MALSQVELEAALDQGDLGVHRDEGELSIEPSSIDLHLGEHYGRYADQDHAVKVWDESTYPDFITNQSTWEISIRPGEFLLGHTEETVTIPPGLVGYLDGRSSVGRLGVFVENAGLVDAGFTGSLTLELLNTSKNTVALKPGMRICQITLHEHGEEPDVPYSPGNGNKYQGQILPRPSELYKDFEDFD